MNDPHRDALEAFVQGEVERILDPDPATGEVPFEPDETPRSGWDPETGALPWEGGGIENGRIVSIEGLDRMGDHLADYEAGIAQNQALHDAAVKRLEARLERIQAPLHREAGRIRTMVEAFALEQGRKGICIGRAKSRTLPSGLELSWRERKKGEYRWDQKPGLSGKPPTLTENRERLLRWAREEEARRAPRFEEPLVVPGPDLPDVDAIKRYVPMIDAPQVAPPGLEYLPPGETFTGITFSQEKP